jgi:hypothetical protein
VHLVWDNYATHKTALIRDWLAKRPRWHVHLTRTSSSWLNHPVSDVGDPRQQPGVDKYARLLGSKIIESDLVLRPLQPANDWLIHFGDPQLFQNPIGDVNTMTWRLRCLH